MSGGKNGFRQKAQPSKKEQIRQADANVKNLQMAVRIMQMSLQQLASSYQNITNDMSKLMSVVNNLQYRSNALQQLTNLSEDAIVAKADELKLNDYNEASDKEDAEKGLTLLETVAADSICIITSTCNEENKDKGIFRSKFNLDQCGVPELQQKLLGCKVGDKVECKLNGTDHLIELLGIRQAPPKIEPKTDEVQQVVVEAKQEQVAAQTTH
jgi:hypothetical protein